MKLLGAQPPATQLTQDAAVGTLLAAEVLAAHVEREHGGASPSRPEHMHESTVNTPLLLPHFTVRSGQKCSSCICARSARLALRQEPSSVATSTRTTSLPCASSARSSVERTARYWRPAAARDHTSACTHPARHRGGCYRCRLHRPAHSATQETPSNDDIISVLCVGKEKVFANLWFICCYYFSIFFEGEVLNIYNSYRVILHWEHWSLPQLWSSVAVVH